jgi:hypothetical protein
MATPRTTITDRAGRIIEMQATPAYNNDAAFDSYLILKENGCDNHTLTLVLKLHLNKVEPTTIRLPLVGKLQLPYPDWDGTYFAIKPWDGTAYSAFQRQFLRQCAYWNDKFWLIPPAGFTGLDYKFGGRTIRPNIYCHLYVSVVATAGGSHRTFSIVNLDKPSAARQLRKSEKDLDASDFRSDSVTYDSLDTRPVPLPFEDNKGKVHSKVPRSTIAHEIGHALGLPHIGVSHGAGAPQCQVAVLADSLLPKSITSHASFPALYKGAGNSQACYGSSGPASLGKNVMGYGLEFDHTNAQPWLDRIALHTKTRASDWKVSVKTRVAPKRI